MINRLHTGSLLSLLLGILLWAGCAGPAADIPRAADGTTAVPSGTTEPVEDFEMLDDGDLEMVAVQPELTRAEERGQMIFRHYCAHCHGLTGRGDGQNSYGMDTLPRDLLTMELDASRSDDELRLVITGGGTARNLSPLMPPWGHTLEPARIADLVAMIHILPDLDVQEGDDLGSSLDDDAGMDDFSL